MGTARNSSCSASLLFCANDQTLWLFVDVSGSEFLVCNALFEHSVSVEKHVIRVDHLEVIVVSDGLTVGDHHKTGRSRGAQYVVGHQ